MSTRFYKSLTGASLAVANTFTAAQTFNAGIVFNAAGSIASTSTYIEADGAGGNIFVNVPTGKFIGFYIAGTNTVAVNNASIYANSDNAIGLGGSSNRWTAAEALLFNVRHASGDTNPSAQLGDGFMKFGAGGAAALYTSLSYYGGNGLGAGFAFQPTGTGTASVSILQGSSLPGDNTFAIYATTDTTNYARLEIDASSGNGLYFKSTKAGTGTLLPQIWLMGGTESFRIKTDGSFQFTTGPINISDALNIVLGSTTGTKLGTATTQKLGFFNATPIVQPNTAGTATGYTAGATAATFHSDDTYTGNTGATAYTLNGIVANLKNLGLIAA